MSLAYQDEYYDELLNGKTVMRTGASVNHNTIASNIYYAFRNYLKGKMCRAFSDGVDVYLSETDRVIPDATIVCNRSIIKPDGIHGTPDLVVEVLSPSTAKNDKGYKKDLYEKSGVKEYWLVDPIVHSIEVYLCSNEKFTLDGIYAIYPDGYGLTEKEKMERANTVPVSLFDDFEIPLADIFEDLF